MAKRKVDHFVFELSRAWQSRVTGAWNPSGASELYATLAGAQKQIELTWLKEPDRHEWRTEHQDIIQRRNVFV